NDIADLGQARVSQQVIDAMIDTAPPADGDAPAQRQDAPPGTSGTREPPHAQSSRDDDYSDYDDEGSDVEAGPDYSYYAEPPPAFYPLYPIYYPVYYPVYDPFFSFFGGFSFSFAFIDPFGFHAVFPCDRSFVVVRNSFGFHHGTVPIRGHTFVTSRH